MKKSIYFVVTVLILVTGLIVTTKGDEGSLLNKNYDVEVVAPDMVIEDTTINDTINNLQAVDEVLDSNENVKNNEINNEIEKKIIVDSESSTKPNIDPIPDKKIESKPAPSPTSEKKPTPVPEKAPVKVPEVRRNKLCIGSSCGSTSAFLGIELEGYQKQIDSDKIVSYGKFDPSDNKSTYYAGHQGTAFAFIRTIIKKGSIIDIYDENGDKSSYKIVSVVNSNLGGQWNGEWVEVYGGEIPQNALWTGINEEVIYLQYCHEGYTDRVYVWSAVKI